MLSSCMPHLGIDTIAGRPGTQRTENSSRVARKSSPPHHIRREQGGSTQRTGLTPRLVRAGQAVRPLKDNADQSWKLLQAPFDQIGLEGGTR